MNTPTWQVTIVTHGKVYRGSIAADGATDRRTISVLNNTNKPARITDDMHFLEGYVQIVDAVVLAGLMIENYANISVKKSEIIFAYDEFDSMGTDFERVRYATWKHPRDSVMLNILSTHQAGHSYRLIGYIIKPWLKINGKDQFLPMTSVRIEKMTAKQATPTMTKDVPFVAVNKDYIEAVTTMDAVTTPEQEDPYSFHQVET